MRIVTAAALAGVVALGACASGGVVTGAIPGANPGRVVNSPVGSGAGEPPIGAVEGGLMGIDVGRSLNDADRAVAIKAEYEALEYGRPGDPTRWRGSSGGVDGKISVGSMYQVNRLDCREYVHTLEIGGRARVVRGTACRQPDGVWRIIG